jgi:hypothetical protein
MNAIGRLFRMSRRCTLMESHALTRVWSRGRTCQRIWYMMRWGGTLAVCFTACEPQ